MSFTARYPGFCTACDERTHPGDEVDYLDGERTKIVHANCPELADLDAPQRNERQCPDCFLIHAGECA